MAGKLYCYHGELLLPVPKRKENRARDTRWTLLSAIPPTFYQLSRAGGRQGKEVAGICWSRSHSVCTRSQLRWPAPGPWGEISSV